MDGWICKLMSVLLIKLKKDEQEKRTNLIGEEGLPSILKQATTKSNHDDIWHQIPSYTTTLSQNSKEQAVDRMRHGEMTEQQWDEPEEDQDALWCPLPKYTSSLVQKILFAFKLVQFGQKE